MILRAVLEKAEQFEDFLIQTRRYLHKNPELSGQEYGTTRFLHQKLTEAGIHSEILNTEAGPAVIASIVSDEKNPTIAFRADIDALPVFDKTEVPYSSNICGICHACGHDFNTTVILGLAYVMATVKDQLNVNLKFIFQPSEEASGGALALVKAGVLKDISAIFSLHACPDYEVGKVGVKVGALTAGIDIFKFEIKGRGGHSARPHEAVDSIFIANKIMDFLYTDINRHYDPLDPIVISVGKISGGSAPNIISETCYMEGTVRSFSKELRSALREYIISKVQHICKLYDAEISIDWQSGTAPVINDAKLVKVVELSATELLNVENVIKIDRPSMGAEDFAYYLDHIPGMLLRIGTRGDNAKFPLHNPKFNIDENAIQIGVKVLAAVILNIQENKIDSLDYIKNFACDRLKSGYFEVDKG